ncbi:MAG: type I DNA topoisomerase [bacterium]|nr:type I DNA topoisomerase [bacterium]
MAEALVIVESPAKAKTIGKYLGSQFEVTSSVGHIKDLPDTKLGIDVEKNFEAEYVVIKGKKKVIQDIKKSANGKKCVFLAPDPDREGEAIAWHIASELDPKKYSIFRVTFNEITREAIQDAFKNPRQIDMNKVNAQQARRILDRLVGYKISPLLWRKLFKGLSAGRVQSVALKMICDREDEITRFIKEEYWSITAHLKTADAQKFQSKLLKHHNKNIKITNEQYAKKILDELKNEPFHVQSVTKTTKKRHPFAPFITSTLQQEAARHFGFNANKTMSIAQALYEGISIGAEGLTGLITYMRTDSTRIADSALNDARSYISLEFGKHYLPAKPNRYASKKAAQDAHEAVRPTQPSRSPEKIRQYLTEEQFKLYSLIWKRFIASQMEPALMDQTSVDITAGAYLFRTTGSIVKFDGFTRLYTEKNDSEQNDDGSGDESAKQIPDLKQGDKPALIKFEPKQHFTQPPPRYSEATLIKALEENGIGRPSTYAAIMSRILDKNYTTKIKNKFHPTDLGQLITKGLTNSFAKIMNEKFTAEMENELDEIENGTKDWQQLLANFYQEFDVDLGNAYKTLRFEAPNTTVICENCNTPMVIRWSKNGPFLACPNYPECTTTYSFSKAEDGTITPIKKEKPASTDTPCPMEGCDGFLIERKGRRGQPFYGCTKFPKCRLIARSLEPKDLDEGVQNAQNPPAKKTYKRKTTRKK